MLVLFFTCRYKRHLFSLLACLLRWAAPEAVAQPNYQPGYVVMSTGDTLRGLVNDRAEMKNARECSFKAVPDEAPRQYGPEQLNGYGFTTGKMYESRRIRLDSVTVATVFVELLVKGRLSLYHYKVGDRYFAEKPPEELRELTRVEKRIERDGIPYVVVHALYKGTLTYMTLDCPRLKRKIDRLPLDLDDLLRVVQEYNACSDTTASVRTRRKFVTLKAGLVAGTNRSRLRFTGGEAQDSYLTQAPLSLQAAPFAGLYLQTTIPWVTERLTLWFEGQLSRDDYWYYREFTKGESTYREDVSAYRRYFRFPALLRYTYPKGRVRPFAQAGFRLDLALESRNSVIQERELFRQVTTIEKPAFAMRNSEVGGVAGAGLELRFAKRYRLHAELRGSYGNGLAQPSTSLTYYRSRTTTWSLQAGFGF